MHLPIVSCSPEEGIKFRSFASVSIGVIMGQEMSQNFQAVIGVDQRVNLVSVPDQVNVIAGNKEQ